MRRVKFSAGDLATLKKPFDHIVLRVTDKLANNQFECVINDKELVVIDKKEMRWKRCDKSKGGRKYAHIC